MSEIATATSDTMFSPSDSKKFLEEQQEIYHQLQANNSLKRQKRDPDDHADEATLARQDSFRDHPQAGPACAGDKKKKKKLRRGMRFPGDEEDETPLKQIGRGLLTILTTPIAFAGMGVYAAGVMVEGTGAILKGIGSVGRHAFVSPNPRRRDASTASNNA